MYHYAKRKVESLSEWLAIATKGLAQAGKQRISQEIEAHYEEALKTHLDQGESKRVAEASALADLGDPKVAGKRFRKKHLTEKEAKRLEWATNTGSFRSLLFLYFIFAFLCFVVLLATDSFANPERHFVLCIVTFCLSNTIFPTIIFLMARRGLFRRSISLFPLMLTVSIASSALIFALMMNPSLRFYSFLSTFLTVRGFSWLRLWNKVHRIGADGNEAPTPA